MEEVHVGERHERKPADDRHAAERLHRGVHRLARGRRVGPALLIDARHRLDGHRVGHRILDHVAGGGDQRGKHEPAIGAHHRAHVFGVRDQPDHDGEARGNHRRPQPDQQRFPAPD
jgi:hypothetical protein